MPDFWQWREPDAISGITVVVPTLPSRADLLRRALRSVEAQTLRPAGVIVVADVAGQGAPLTRQAGLDAVQTPWVAFLDDDDEFKPEHLEALAAAAADNAADFVFSWYDVVGGTDPNAEQFGLPWDREHPRETTITTLVRAGLARYVGGFAAPETVDLSASGRRFSGEDWLFTNRINDAGGRIYHLPQRTWRWHHHASNTGGLPTTRRSGAAEEGSRRRRKRPPRRGRS